MTSSRAGRPGLTGMLLAALLLGSARPGTAADVVAPQDAAEHAGQVVTVEGEVRSARATRDTIVLELAGGLRVVVVVPLFATVPRDPARTYEGRRVRATGRVERFRGRLELVVRSPDQVELPEQHASASAPAPAGGSPPSLPAAAPPPESPPMPAAAPPAAAVPRVPAPPAAVALRNEAAPCERARAGWRRAAADARERLVDLTRCLDAAGYRCEAERLAVAPALAALEASERDVAGVCP